MVCILSRAWLAKQLSRYPFFFGYISCVLLSTLVRLYLQPVTSHAYWLGYWISQFISAVAGFGVTWEIYSHVLAPYQGLRKMARTVLCALFALMLANAIAEVGSGSAVAIGPTTLELERNLRVVQALLLVGLLGVTVYYKVPIGRNIRSVLAGYGLYIGCMVIALTLRSEWGDGFEQARYLMAQLSWNIAALIWFVGMWSHSRDPVVDTSARLDYDRVHQGTMRALGQLRTNVTETWRL